MALMGWYPLNGDYRNNGAGGVEYGITPTSTLSTPSFVADGKVASGCFSTNVSAQDNSKATNVHTNASAFKETGFSIACWFKTASLNASVNQWLFQVGGGDYDGGNANARVGIGLKVKNGLYINVDSGNFWIGGGIAANKWHHVSLCVDNDNNVTVYLDGASVYTRKKTRRMGDTSALVFGSLYTSSYYNFMGRIQDARYYDHCLSPLEVKMLAWGGIAHFPLSTYDHPLLPKGSRPNLIYRGSLRSGKPDNCTGVYTVNSGAFMSYDPDGLYYESSNTNNKLMFEFANNMLRCGETYTFSIKVSGAGTGGEIRIYTNYINDNNSYQQNGITYYLPSWCAETETAVITFTVPVITGKSTANWRFDVKGGSNGEWMLSDLKLELGSTSTEFNDLNDTNTNIYHTISMCNVSHPDGNELKMPSQLYYYDAPILEPSVTVGRGRMHLKLKNSYGRYAHYELPSGIDLSDCTVSFHAKVDEIGASGFLPIAGGTSSAQYLFATANGTGNFYKSTNGSDDYTVPVYIDGKRETKPTGVNGWHHYVVKGCNLTGWGILMLNNYNASTNWNSAVRFSDLKIFANSLSDEDIKTLHASEMIDKNGAIYASEFVDDNRLTSTITSPNFRSNGIVEAKNVTEVQLAGGAVVETDGSMFLSVFYMDMYSGNHTLNWSGYKNNIYGHIRPDRTNWFADLHLMQALTKFEFIYEQKQNANSAVERFRWSQTKNPLDCAYADAARANCTYVTNGYTAPGSTYGGLWKQNGNQAFLICNNGTSGKTYGRVCPYENYSTSDNGVPGWNSKWIGDGGYIKLYVRADEGYIKLNASVYDENVVHGNRLNEF